MSVALVALIGCASHAPPTVAPSPLAAAAPPPSSPSAPPSAPPPAPLPPEPAAPPAPTAAPKTYGQADRDPDNDYDVGPPDPIPDCHERLRAAGIEFRAAKLPLRQKRQGKFTCGSTQAVVYLKGPEGIRYSPAPTLDCGMALALARFDAVVQEEAERHLGTRVRSIKQLGTYNCRKMVRYSWISEHSYANAIDLAEFRLERGPKVVVLRHFQPKLREPQHERGRFLRAIARRAFDEHVFSVVLTPFWDKLHANHFHVDLARYRVDTSRFRE